MSGYGRDRGRDDRDRGRREYDDRRGGGDRDRSRSQYDDRRRDGGGYGRSYVFCIIYSNLFQVVAVEVAEVAVGVTVVADGAEEEAAAVDEADSVASVIVLSPLIGIDWTAPDDVKLKRQKQ